jgi:hypothetical protein
VEDYGKLVYLDVQKTGSTFISAFLRECANLGLHHSEQHARVAEARPGTIYAISVRHPLEQYVSLFRYGLDEKGAVFSRIKSIGREDLYHADGFDDWMRFILDAANAKVLGEGYADVAGLGMGFQTWRFLALSVVNPRDRFLNAGVESLKDIYRQHNIASVILRNESLNADLREKLVSVHPDWFDLEKAEAVLSKGDRINASTTQIARAKLPPDINEVFFRKEAFLLDQFYPNG